MSLERSYKTISESSKIIKTTLVLAVLLNLSAIHEWVQKKEVSAITTSFSKLTEAMREIGDLFYLNVFRDNLRASFLPLTNSVVTKLPTETTINPMLPDLKDPKRQVAAIDPSSTEVDFGELDLTEIDLIDEVIDDQPKLPKEQVGVTVTEPKGSLGHKNVLIIGDSILKSGLQEHFERNLNRKNKKIAIQIKSKSGTGLSRPDVFNWISYIDENKNQFDKTIIFLGTNDAQNLVVAKKIVPFDSKEWKAEYSLRVRSLLEKACVKSKHVYWISSLRMRSDTFDAKMRALHEVVRKEIKSHPSCAQYVSAFQWFTKKTKYTDTWVSESKKSGKKTIKLRAADGIHLTYWGADLFSQKIIEAIYE